MVLYRVFLPLFSTHLPERAFIGPPLISPPSAPGAEEGEADFPAVVQVRVEADAALAGGHKVHFTVRLWGEGRGVGGKRGKEGREEGGEDKEEVEKR